MEVHELTAAEVAETHAPTPKAKKPGLRPKTKKKPPVTKPAPKKAAPKKKTVAKPKAKKPTPKKKTSKPVKKAKAAPAIVRSERLDLRLSKREKAMLRAKAAKLRRTLTSIFIEFVEKLK